MMEPIMDANAVNDVPRTKMIFLDSENIVRLEIYSREGSNPHKYQAEIGV